ncbi:hypothetical protein J6590_011418 [Homalodisca vitripennis]|nr:hypothetical protein J6590_011418 [Homalodisca vitripennis]
MMNGGRGSINTHRQRTYRTRDYDAGYVSRGAESERTGPRLRVIHQVANPSRKLSVLGVAITGQGA